MIKRSLPGSASRHIAPNRPLTHLISESIAIGFAWARDCVSFCVLGAGKFGLPVVIPPSNLSNPQPRASPEIQAAIFDFDGTLADSLGGSLAFRPAGDEFGFDRIDKNQVATLRRHDAATLLRLPMCPF